MKFTFSSKACPRCKSTIIKRSKEHNFFEFLVSFVVISCRCYSCELRFFRPRWCGIPPEWPRKEKNASATAGS
jgi:hypothetical protein